MDEEERGTRRKEGGGERRNEEEQGIGMKEGRGGRRDEESEKLNNAKGRIIGLAGPCYEVFPVCYRYDLWCCVLHLDIRQEITMVRGKLIRGPIGFELQTGGERIQWSHFSSLNSDKVIDISV